MWQAMWNLDNQQMWPHHYCDLKNAIWQQVAGGPRDWMLLMKDQVNVTLSQIYLWVAMGIVTPVTPPFVRLWMYFYWLQRTEYIDSLMQ